MADPENRTPNEFGWTGRGCLTCECWEGEYGGCVNGDLLDAQDAAAGLVPTLGAEIEEWREGPIIADEHGAVLWSYSGNDCPGWGPSDEPHLRGRLAGEEE